MGLNFRKSIKVLPGVRVNITKKGVSSLSVGGRGARVNMSKKGTRTTVGIPGSGLSYSSFSPSKKSRRTSQPMPALNSPDYGTSGNRSKAGSVISIVVALLVLVAFFWIIK